MVQFKRVSIKKIPRLNIPLSIALFIILAVVISVTSTIIQPGPVTMSLAFYLKQPILFVLNGFPVVMLLGIFLCITKNVFTAGAITSLIVNLMSYVNLIKIDTRYDPFIPADIAYIKEAMNAVSEYSLNLYVRFILLILGLAAGLFAAGHFVKTAHFKGPIARTAVGASLVLVTILSVLFIYPSQRLTDYIHVPQKYDLADTCNKIGFNYYFLRSINTYKMVTPTGYSAKEVKGWIEEETKDFVTPAVTPNVIFLMCEAFSDLSNEDVFTYSETENPLYWFNEISKEKNALAGSMIISNYGAGTANTEFNVLTGMVTNMLAPGQPSAFRFTRRSINTIPRIFTANGYDTYFMHPGYSWFYGRSFVYEYLGFDNLVFKEAFTEEDKKGTQYSDEAFLRVFTEALTQKFAQDAPLFASGVTMQNHQYYDRAKYPFIPDDAPMNTEPGTYSKVLISVYMEGLRDSSVMLKQLRDYLNAVDEPTMLVFYGDHLPNLGAQFNAYREAGLDVGNFDTPESVLNTYRVPYLIWVNDCLYSQMDFEGAVDALDLPENKTINSAYLGSMVCEMLGFDSYDPFISFMNSARRSLPAFFGESYMLQDGSYVDTLPEDIAGLPRKINKWMYYRMKEEAVK